MSLARKGASVFLANWLILPLQIFTMVIVVRYVGAEGKGVLTILNTTVALITALGQFGMPAAAIYFLRGYIYNERTLLASYGIVILAFTLGIATLVFFASNYFIEHLLQGTNITLDLLVLALSEFPLSMAVTFVSTLLLAKAQANEYARFIIGMSALSALLTLLFVGGMGLGLMGAIIGPIAAQFATLLIMMWVILSSTRGQKYSIKWRIIRDLLRFGAQYYSGTLGSQLFERADNFLLAYFLDAKSVGYYSVAATIYTSVLSIPQAVYGMLAGESAAQGRERAAIIVARAARNVLWLTIIAAILLALISPRLIPLLYGLEFVASSPPVLILLPAAVLIGLTINLQAYFLAIGKPAVNGAIIFLAGVINLLFSLWLIPTAGILGNAAATFFGSLASFFLFVLWFRHSTGVPLRSLWMLKADDFRAWYTWLYGSMQRIHF